MMSLQEIVAWSFLILGIMFFVLMITVFIRVLIEMRK